MLIKTFLLYLHHQIRNTMTPHFNYYPNNISIVKVTNFETIMSNYFKETPLYDSDHDKRLFDEGQDDILDKEDDNWPRRKKNADDEDYDNQDDEDFITF